MLKKRGKGAEVTASGQVRWSTRDLMIPQDCLRNGSCKLQSFIGLMCGPCQTRALALEVRKPDER